MNVHPSRVIHREIVAHQTLACVLERPPGFDFHAGQYIDVTLGEPLYDDMLGPTRSFSIASAPIDRDLLLVMRMRNSAFKRSLADAPPNAPVLIDGPADDLALTLDDGRPTVLVAGGVGIAPFLGALRDASARGRPLATTLFYSNRRPEDAAYLAELRTLETRIPGLRVIATMTRMGGSACPWSGTTERLGAAMLARHLPAVQGPKYYLSGSTLFISGLCQELARAGVLARDIRIEMYTGY